MRFSDADLRELRQRYNTAYAAYKSCVDAMTELCFKGDKPSSELLEQEAKALRELNEARTAYRNALLDSAFSD